MDPFGITVFVGFGLLIGVLFGFFGMGGSFLVTPALLVMGYSSQTAVGSGLAFVFGTSFIAALKHRDHGQVDYKLGGIMILGMTAGIEVGKTFVDALSELGFADTVVSAAYVLMLGTVGIFVLRDARTEDIDERHPVARRVRNFDAPPRISLTDGGDVSLWLTMAIALFVGVLSGFLGVGGGFLLMPAMMYGLGVPAAVAVGTDVFQITVSGGFGAFRYAQAGNVALPVVASLLAGSTLGARVGSAATNVVEEGDIKGYFAAMLLGGSVAVAAKEVGSAYGIEALNTVSIVLVFGSALLVAGAVVYTTVSELRRERAIAAAGD
ncbi:sulfite exporter TauE/SafE family protein [Halorussus limi]|uniref:Probable membrane transporter protein n=1 Tax=Halorussus limi TaxID=2938695 RepID=A0A8U0HPQ4_9EURY|nr:sulfite exporter TauE/SafE family protein [Halorussus limi]UPV72839.1 sulfite exporter TauE/SafE family protein [Halorussus limi]